MSGKSTCSIELVLGNHTVTPINQLGTKGGPLLGYMVLSSPQLKSQGMSLLGGTELGNHYT